MSFTQHCMMTSSCSLAILLMFLYTSLAQLPHETCRVKYKKVGCFDVGSSFKMLFSDRVLGSSTNKGHEIDWYKWEKYLHSVTCRCNEESRLRGDIYFSLGFYGECYGSPEYPTGPNLGAAACISHFYAQCVDKTNKECIGTVGSHYVYEVGNDGGYTDWGKFSGCSKTCGDGTQTRKRNCTNPSPSGYGRNCSHIGPSENVKPCNLGSCTVDGGFSSWTSFGKCTKTCGGGYMSRERFCNNPAPVNGGKNCSGPSLETKSCVNDMCRGPVGVSKAEAVVESFLLNFHNSSFPTKAPSGKFHQAIFAIQKAVANEFALASSNKSLAKRLTDLRKFLKVATAGGSIDFARTTLGKSLFVFMKKKIDEGLPIDDLDKAAKGYLESIKKDVGSEKFGELMLEKGDATLMFTVDTTGSMGDEIAAAKSIAQYIINIKRKFPVDFILSPFNDPGHGPVTHKDSKQTSAFVSAIQSITVNGGGDCPELAFTGMIDALKAGPKLGSPMFVFTDASPKDDTPEKKQTLKDIASQYSCPITFFTNLRGCGDAKGIKSYEEIAAYTSGQIFPLLSHTELLKFKDFIQNSLKSKNTIAKSTISASSRKRSSSLKGYKISVDNEMTALMISLSVKQINAGAGILLADPTGARHAAQSSTPYSKVFNVQSPLPGIWSLLYPPGIGEISFVASAVSDKALDFQHYFMHQERPNEGSPVLTIPNPLKGRQASLVLRVSNVDLLDRKSLRADIVDERGALLLGDVALKMMGGGAFEASLTPPSQKFKVALKGSTKSGHAFQRLSSRFSEAQKAAMVVIGAGEEFTASVATGTSNIVVYIYNGGEAEQLSFQATANYGSVSAHTANKVVPKASNTTIEFTYALHGSASSHVGKTDSVTIKATGPSSNSIQIPLELLIVP